MNCLRMRQCTWTHVHVYTVCILYLFQDQPCQSFKCLDTEREGEREREGGREGEGGRERGREGEREGEREREGGREGERERYIGELLYMYMYV